MALIKCPECGRSLSDQAAACPHCGCPVNKEDIVQKSQEYVEAKKKKSDKEHSKQLKIFWTVMMFGAFVGLPFFLGFLVIFTGITSEIRLPQRIHLFIVHSFGIELRSSHL